MFIELWHRILPTDVPGVVDVEKVNDPYEKVELIESTILKAENYDGNFFFSYVELHEFEAMLFSNLTKLKETYFEYDLTDLEECAKVQSNPELINNGEETAPSKRIIKRISCYDKANVGVDVFKKIGIENIAEKCHHFSEWIRCIEDRL